MSRKKRFYKEIEEFWDDFSSSYDFKIHKSCIGLQHLSRIEEKVLEKYLDMNIQKILEIGCGTGRLTRKMLDLNKKVFGIDLSENMALKLNRSKNFTFIKTNAGNKFPFNDTKFDFAVSMRVLKYIPDWNNTLSEVYRVLKPNSIFIFSIANKRSLAFFKSKNVKYFLFNTKDVIKYTQSLGFKIMEVCPTTKLPFDLYKKINSGILLKITLFIESALNIILGRLTFSRAWVLVVKK